MVLSEKAVIKMIRKMSGAGSGKVLTSIGDDCAVIQRDGGMVELITTDTLVENVHFDLSWHGPVLLGRKAAAVNISDVAAMGGKPIYCLLSLALPTGLADSWSEQFMSGFLAKLNEYGACLIGGDTVKSEKGVVISVTVVGEAVAGEVLLRSTARAGDLVMVSGSLGEAAAGLELCRRGEKEVDGRWRDLLMAHLDPSPETELAKVLAASGLVSAMMDISDGLATDLAHICGESGLAAEVEGGTVPISTMLREAADTLALEPLNWALSGGEDYRLLLAVSESDGAELQRLVKMQTGRELITVGRLKEGSGVALVDGDEQRDITYQGYDHFS
jgi:thiamine-monophosphate kinase